MPDGWSEVKVDDVKSPSQNSLVTGPFGSAISSRFFVAAGVPVIRGSNLSEQVGIRLNHDDLVFVTPEKALEFRRSVARLGDLIFTCWGTIGQVGLIDEKCPFREYVISNKQMKLTPDPSRADSLFLYYLFSGPEMLSRVTGQSIGSSVPGFNLGQLRSLKLTIPPIDEQQAIARVLSSLDDKIELTRRMNGTLEAIARALFKSWFVDFDPVRAKAEGRQPPGLDAETAALFPDSFEDSSLGMIPSGWLVSTLGHCADFVSGGTPAKSNPDYWGGSIPWVSAKDMKTPRLLDAEDHVTFLGVSNGTRMVPAGTILMLVRGMTLHNDVPVCIAMTDLTFNQDVKALRPRPEIGYEFLFLWLMDQKPFLLASVDAASHGTGRIHTDLLKQAELLLPPPRTLLAFRNKVSPLFARLLLNDEESRTLAALRDTLLPKLLSGEVRVGGKGALVQ